MSTKRDFEKTARILREAKPSAAQVANLANRERSILMYAWLNVVVAFTDAYTIENPRFDRKRFETACGLES